MMVRKSCQYRMLRLFIGAMAILVVLVTLSASVDAMAWGPLSQKSFGSPQQAVDALVVAVQDDNDAELLAILGPGSEDLIFSGDPVADQNGRSRFLKAYKEKNSLEKDSEGYEVLLVGSKDYPFPIPIVPQKDDWVFDTQAGMEEILNRRIGKNELHTIEVMHAYTDAQREYACIVINDAGGSVFAQQFTSSEGKKDGLYWESEESETESPFGPLIARATEEGYAGDLDKEPPESFHGYYFKILTAQGEHANGGTFNYVADDKMVLGFALVAYPAKYGASGIMTFIVNQEGVIYEKDFGYDTPKAAEMTSFDPDETWRKYKEEPTEQ